MWSRRPISKLNLVLYSASFAGDLRCSKATTGGILCLDGPNTFVSWPGICKKQGAVFHSSKEAKVVSLDAMMRLDGVPRSNLWSQLVDVSWPNEKRNLSDKTSKNNPSAYAKHGKISVEFCDWAPSSLPPFSSVSCANCSGWTIAMLWLKLQFKEDPPKWNK